MIWANGSIVQDDLSPNIIIDSGSWVYEVIRIQCGYPIFLTEHLDRLESALASALPTVKYSQDDLTTGIFTLLKTEGMNIGNIRIQLNILTGEVVIGQIPHHYPTKDQMENGICVGVLDKERTEPNIKFWNPDVRLSADNEIKSKGVYEVLLVNSENQITEGSRSNIFGIVDEHVITPPLHQILPGITRQIILNLCKDTGIFAHEKVILHEHLKEFEALFISGTSPGVLPVKNLGDLEYNASHPLIEIIKSAYNQKVEQNNQQSVEKQEKRKKYGK